MGFFDKLQDIWGDWTEGKQHLKKSYEGAKTFYGQQQKAYRNFAVGTWNLAATAFWDDSHWDDAKKAYREFGRNFTGAAGGGVGAVFSAPLIDEVAHSALWAQNEAIKRPLGTLYQQYGDAMRFDDASKFFEGSAWRQAYNDTRRVSTGQAFGYAAGSVPGLWSDDEDDLWTPDPRTAEGYGVYTSKEWNKYKLLSGGIDAAVDLGLDPTILGGKLAKAAKLGVLSKPMTADRIAAGGRDTYVTGQRATKLFEQARALSARTDGYERFHRGSFGGMREGWSTSSVLYQAANIADPGIARRTFDDALAFSLGDTQAGSRLRANAPNIAQEIARSHTSEQIRDAAQALATGRGRPEHQELYAGALRGDMEALMADDVAGQLERAIAQNEGAWGRLQGSLVGEYQPRVSITGKWKAGVHASMVTGSPRRAFFGVSPRDLMPSARFTPAVAIESAQSSGDFAMNLERWGRLDPTTRAGLLAEYARASTPQSRQAIIQRAEEAAILDTATHYGLSAQQARELIPRINEVRSANTALFNSNRRFVAAEVRRAAEAAMRDGRPDRAQSLSTSARAAEEAVARGDQPREVISVLDMDGNPIHIANDWAMPGVSTPVLQSQSFGQVIPMMDARAFEAGLWWNTRGAAGSLARRTGEASYTGMNRAMATVDAFNYAWKVGSLLRPGYVWRVLSDEVLRRISVFGTTSFLIGSANGMGRSAVNMAGRGAILAESLAGTARRGALSRQNARGLDPSDPSLGPAESVGTMEARRAMDQPATVTEWTDQVLAQSQRGMAVPVEVQPFISNFRNSGMPSYGRQQLERDLADYVLWREGQNAYRSPTWQNTVVNDLVPGTRTGATRVRPATRGETEARGQAARDRIVAADPFTGRRTLVQSLDDVDVMGTERLPMAHRGQTGNPGDLPGDLVYDYVHRHMDELNRPGAVLVAQLDNTDNLMLSVGRTRDPAVAAVPDVAGGKRLTVRIPFTKTVLEGSKTRYLREGGAPGTASPYYVNGIPTAPAFAGSEGAAYRGLASSAGTGGAYTDFLSKVEHERLAVANGNRTRTLTYGNDAYAGNWERMANAEIAGDPVARMLLQGRNVDDAIQWVRNTKAGQAYLAKMGPMQARYVEQLYTIGTMVDKYAPMYRGLETEGAALRQKILNREATVADLEAAAGHADRMPAVLGAELDVAFGTGAIGFVRKQVNKAFNVIANMPSDKASRLPFFNEAYRRHVQELGKVANFEAGRGATVGVNEVEKIQTAARERALFDTRKYLYDTASRLDLANAGRVLVPFSSAVADSYLKWGTIMKEKPWVGYNLWKAWTAPDRAGLVEDGSGAKLRVVDGREQWYFVNPSSGEEMALPADYKPNGKYVQFQLPEGFGPLPKGMRYSERVNKDSFNTFLNVATTGPIVGVPMNEFTLDNPEYSENWAVKRFVLPFGPSRDMYRQVLPGTVRTAWEAFAEQDGDSATSQAMAIYQAEMVEYAQGRREDPPTFAEVREKAAGVRQMRFLSYFSGLAGTIETPYQPYYDYWQQLLAKKRGPDDPSAEEEFVKDVGDEFFVFTARVSQNRLGIPATLEANKQWKNMSDLAASYPEIAGWIVGAEGGGAFNRAVYEAQFRQKISPGSDKTIRTQWSLQESVEDVQRRQGWLEYSRMMDDLDTRLKRRGLTSYASKNAADLKKVKDQFLAQHKWANVDGQRVVSPWFADYSSFDQSKTLRVLNGLQQATKDPRMAGRDDVRGLVQYLALRENTRRTMAQLGAKTLTNKKVQFLAQRWNKQTLALRQSNLAFADLYNRFLERDDLSADLSGKAWDLAGVVNDDDF